MEERYVTNSGRGIIGIRIGWDYKVSERGIMLHRGKL